MQSSPHETLVGGDCRTLFWVLGPNCRTGARTAGLFTIADRHDVPGSERHTLGGRRADLAALAAAGLLAGASRPAQAQTVDELAKETQNPVASLISVPFQRNWDFGIGDREATGTTLNIQPVAPFGLTRDLNVILRVIMPVASQPADSGRQRLTGVGDTTMTVFLSPARTGKLIWGAGPAFLIPTATNQGLGTENFGLGRRCCARAARQVDCRRPLESDLVARWRQRSGRRQSDVPAAVRQLQPAVKPLNLFWNRRPSGGGARA